MSQSTSTRLVTAQQQGKKYIFHHKEDNLYRIQACKDITIHNPDTNETISISQGDFGGLIGNEKNLSHTSNCWVDKNAKVTGGISVIENAYVGGNATITGKNVSNEQQMELSSSSATSYSSVVTDFAKIYDNATIEGNVSVSGNAKIYDNATVKTETSNTITIKDFSKIYGNSDVTARGSKDNSPYNITIIGNAEIHDNSTVETAKKPDSDSTDPFEDDSITIGYDANIKNNQFVNYNTGSLSSISSSSINSLN